MIGHIHLSLIMLAALIAVASPGPATLSIAGTSMRSGRRTGFALAAGVLTGSFTWSISAAAGLSALMLANAWLIEIIRYFGVGYLLFLAFKSARSALTPGEAVPVGIAAASLRGTYMRGLALHLTNPKAILFFGSLYAFGLPADATPVDLAIVVAVVGLQSAVIFFGYVLLFSNPVIVRGYLKLRRWFEGVFALAFGYAGIKILTAKL
ncbi:MAG TPA: LysE family translocator [Pseudolabrys sp.]|nr:LysE family translocator [Pseudolabrys sp.]